MGEANYIGIKSFVSIRPKTIGLFHCDCVKLSLFGPYWIAFEYVEKLLLHIRFQALKGAGITVFKIFQEIHKLRR